MARPKAGLVTGEDGIVRCGWAGDGPLYRDYHDREWGMPVRNDPRLFEKICLEGFQAGLAWITILRKREAFREVFRDIPYSIRRSRYTAERAIVMVDPVRRASRAER